MASSSKAKKKSKKGMKIKQFDPKDNEIAHLNVLLKYSLRNIQGRSEGLDSLFTAQADRIRAELNKLEQ